MLKRLTMALVFGCAASAAQAQIDMAGCAPVQRGAEFPFDYNDAGKRAKFLKTVEGIHFTRPVETLTRGATAVHPFHDIAYTLNQIPNHPRALQALLRLAAREKATHIQGSSISVECFVKRAIDFAPDDLVPQMILAQYYAAQGKQEAALALLLEAEKKAPDNPNLAYNIGLLQADLKRYDSALTYAHRAYLGGFPLPGLRDKLKRAGAWREPVPAAAQPAAGAAAEAKPAVQLPPASVLQPGSPAAAAPAAVPGAQDAAASAAQPAAAPPAAPASPSADVAPANKP